MAFAEIKQTMGRERSTDVRVGVYPASPSVATVSIPVDIWKVMGSPARVDALRGEGEDEGMLLLSPSEKGYRILQNAKAHSVAVRLSVNKIGLPRTFCGTQPVEHELVKQGLLVGLTNLS